ncbi:GNAT family N-acetyltransferase [Izhakiella australiensis]|uniref:GNAT family N-acetyltransferase n=1 Tax=Izhakiella australiensis TaxID=1926881 RepID=A0A1S8YRD2_9GAMM|nr:GNAT family N-acetyltransferase [Izhakiella australiensis]OON41415.1 GNAT family N-acetyltransferase [Izhakiella australiensis]
MVSFQPMSGSDFSGYLSYFLADYAEEIAANYGLAPEAALAQAKHEITVSLPQGENTPGQQLMSIIWQDKEAQQQVGYLWYSPDFSAKSAFIYDFYLFTAHRNKGLGRKALQQLEQLLAAQGYSQIKLRVAAGNDRAKRVYEANGFKVTGFNMNKLL